MEHTPCLVQLAAQRTCEGGASVGLKEERTEQTRLLMRSGILEAAREVAK